MSRTLLVLLGILSISILGCGEKPAGDEGAGGAGEGTAGETGGDQGTETGQAEEFVLETVDLEVGQWISYGVDAEPGVVKISAVAEESFGGSDCVWIQVEIPQEQTAFQILVDPVLIASSMEGYTGMMDEFMEDPAAWVEQYQDTQSMLTDPEGIERMISFISALKMVKMDQGGQIMAFDLSGVPAVIRSMVDDPQFMTQIQSGMEMNTQTGEMDSLQMVMEQSEFSLEPGTVTVGGSTLDCMTFSMEHEKGTIEISFSTELPILPLARATMTSLEDNETHVLEVRDFGMQGAQNLVPGEPVQTIDAAQFLQMMMAQAQSQPQMQPPQGMQQGIR